MKKLFVLLLAVAFLGSLVLVGCGEEETTTTAAPETTTTMAPETTTTMAPETTTTEAPTTTTTEAAPAAPIPWNEAIDHEGETISAIGPVLAVEDLGEGIGKIQLRIGSTAEGEGLNGMITYDNKDKFDLESYKDKTVIITGMVTVNAFELKAEIELTDPSQIEIATAGALIPWNVAIDHEGEEISSGGPVLAVEDLGEGIGKIQLRIGSTAEGEGLNAMITYDNKDKFDLESYKDKTVVVTGMVTVNAFELKAEIELTDPSQIAVALDWSEVIDHEGETVAAAGPVLAVEDLGEGIGKIQLRIGSTAEGEGLNGMITYDNKDKFDLESYKDQTVIVAGMVTVNAFELKAEIELTDPAQIAVVTTE